MSNVIATRITLAPCPTIKLTFEPTGIKRIENNDMQPARILNLLRKLNVSAPARHVGHHSYATCSTRLSNNISFFVEPPRVQNIMLASNCFKGFAHLFRQKDTGHANQYRSPIG